MKNAAEVMQMAFAAMGGALGAVLGGWDGFLYALVLFVAVDYLTGVLVAVMRRKLSSEAGFRGIARKVVIFCLVAVAQVIDVQIIRNGSVVWTAVIFFYLSNEGLSVLENAAVIGLPIPDKLKAMLIQLADEKKPPEDDEINE